MNLPYIQMDLEPYNVFVFEHINTPEYILFTCEYNKTVYNTDNTNNILYFPVSFSNRYIESVLEQKKSSNSKMINEKNIIYCREINIGTNALGEIHFESVYMNNDNPIKIDPYKVTKATGMFAGVTKIIIDATLPSCKVYFIKGLDYFF